jgi:cation diffusion facilitator CzcD-associated flavoprotein CzcO
MSKDIRIAIIGGGPGGVATAKFLRDEGFEVITIFEQSQDVGGQWDASSSFSGVWQTMTSNTACTDTSFSDLPYDEDIRMFVHHREVHAYLHRYARTFDLLRHLRTGRHVQRISRTGDGTWLVRHASASNPETDSQEETFSHVVVASGRFNKPYIPDIEGLSSFTGECGVIHSLHYRNNDRFRGKRILVVGNSFSGMEIASHIALEPDTPVLSSYRKARYVTTKTAGGVPTDWAFFTQFDSMMERVLSPEALNEGMRKAILGYWGNPASFGCREPGHDVAQASFSTCPYYLNVTSEGKIHSREGLVAVRGRKVVFADGKEDEVDGIVFATGFELHLPFLDAETRGILHADDHHVRLYQHTFHPDLHNLAFVGIFYSFGPYFPVLELQARWAAMVWSGARSMPPRERMLKGIGSPETWAQTSTAAMYHELMLSLAREAGVEPDLTRRSHLARRLLFGPMLGLQFRLDGHGSLPDAEARYVAESMRFGDFQGGPLTGDQKQGLSMLADACTENPALAAMLRSLASGDL